MAHEYLEQQKQYTEFLNELDALFRKHNIEHVYANDSTICFSRSAYDTWTFGSWILRNDGTRRYTRPGITEYLLDSVDPEVSATVEPLVEEPELNSTIIVPEATVIRTDPTGTETLSVTTIKADSQETTPDAAVFETWDNAKQEQVEQEINPKITEYINDLADKLYQEAKARNFPKNTLGEYWTHPAVVRAVKQNGFNESVYMIISANTRYWHMLAERMKEVEQLDKQQNKQANIAKSVVSDKIAEAVSEIEPVSHMETFSTDTILGTWTIKYSDYPESVYLDSKKGIDSICSKAYNWLLIYSRMHPELSPFPTRAMLCAALKDNMKRKKSFSYKWYEFMLDVSYSTPIESEETDNA